MTIEKASFETSRSAETLSHGIADPIKARHDAMAYQGSEFAPHNAASPILTAIDVAGVVGIAIMTLGPLAAYAFGMGA